VEDDVPDDSDALLVTDFVNLILLEKRFTVTPGIHYWCRLVTVADTNNDGLTTRYQ
jgi:hypothetical protein